MLPFHHLITRLPVLLLLLLAIQPLVPTWAQVITESKKNIPAKNLGQAVSVEPRELRFDAVQVGSSMILKVKIHNRSAKAVMIHSIFSNNPSFTSTASGSISIAPFGDREIGVKFQPAAKGVFKGILQIDFDVKGRSKFKIKLTGEGVVDQPPVTVNPAYINTVVAKGELLRHILTLTNMSAVGHNFRIESERDESTLLFPSMPDSAVYETGFEDFTEGTVDGQNGWTSLQGWEVSSANADEGIQHLRGLAMTAGSEFTLIAPAAFESGWSSETEHYSTFTARLNLNNASGASWEMVLRDTYGILVGTLTINPDRTVDIHSSGAQYAWLDTRLDAGVVPLNGYFTIVFELIWGDNEINALNSVNLYIDGNRIFKGYSPGGTIGNVSITCRPETTGATLDIDNLRIGLGNYSPDYITVTPSAGLIAAGESIEVDVAIDPASLEFRAYKQNIVAYIDEADTVFVPVTFEVTGKPWLAIQAPIEMNIHRDRNYEVIYLLNMGGTEVQFEAQSSMSYLAMTPASGRIPREGVVTLRIGTSWTIPGTYSDTLKITTNIEGFPIFYAPVSIRIDPPEEYETTSQNQNAQSQEELLITDGALTLFPNPGETSGLITLEIPGRDVPAEVVQILIVSTTGQVAYAAREMLKSSQFEFTISNELKPGMYLVILRHGQKKYSTRLLIK